MSDNGADQGGNGKARHHGGEAESGIWRFARAERASVVVDAADYFLHMQDSPTYVGASLVHCSKYCARLNGLSCCYIDRSYGSILRCYDIILHLHSLKNNDYLTLLYNITNIYLNTKNLT